MSNIESLQISNARRIYEASRNNDLVVFVGAGVSANSGVPNWEDLIIEFKKSLPDSVQDEHDYLKVAQLYKESISDREYLNSVQVILKDGKTRPNPIHDAILCLDPCHIITTNYDSLIETAVEKARYQYSVIRDDKDIPYAKSSRYLIKMHGDFVSRNIVLAESDYYNYSNNYPLIDTLVKSIFASKTILCVGFSFNDLNLKIILNKIQSMLGKNAKPIYLLADYNHNPVFYNYLKNKGIQPFWLPSDITEKFAGKTPKQLSSSIGMDTYKQLSCLQYDISKPLDLIDALYSYSQMVEGEMPFFYISRLRKILPDIICNWDYTYSMGIQLESEYVKKLIEDCRSFEGKRNLLKEKGDKIHSLIQTAANNCIFEFDHIQLWKLRAFNRCWNKKERDCCSMFLDFDFRALTDRITELEQKEITYSNKDLELPFTKWMLGDIVSAYEIYESLEEKYWASNNAILYFICVFNKRAVFNGSFPLNALPYEKVISLSEKAGRIDLNRVLSDLTLDSRVKDNLSDLINNQYYLDAFSSISRLENEILEDKFKSENGGFSINSHLAELLSKLTRNFDYSHVNYIITTNTGCAYETYRSGIVGLLNGHLIKDAKRANGLVSASRIDMIETSHIKLMMFTLDGKDLKRIFDFYRVDSISLNADALSYLRSVIDNLLRDSSIIKRSLRVDILKSRLLSVMLLYWKAVNLADRTSALVDIALAYDLLSESTQYDFKGILYAIIKEKAYSLSERQCRKLISCFPEMNSTYGLSALMLLVADQMRESGWMVDGLLSSANDERLSRKQRLNEMYLLYDLLPEVSKSEVEEYLSGLTGLNDTETSLVCSFIINKHLYSIVTLDIVDLIYNLHNNHALVHRCHKTLKILYDNTLDREIKDRIYSYCAGDLKLRFIIDPLNYSGDIDIDWLNCVNDDSFKELIKRPNISALFHNPAIDHNLLRRYVNFSQDYDSGNC